MPTNTLIDILQNVCYSVVDRNSSVNELSEHNAQIYWCTRDARQIFVRSSTLADDWVMSQSSHPCRTNVLFSYCSSAVLSCCLLHAKGVVLNPHVLFPVRRCLHPWKLIAPLELLCCQCSSLTSTLGTAAIPLSLDWNADGAFCSTSLGATNPQALKYCWGTLVVGEVMQPDRWWQWKMGGWACHVEVGRVVDWNPKKPTPRWLGLEEMVKPPSVGCVGPVALIDDAGWSRPGRLAVCVEIVVVLAAMVVLLLTQHHHSAADQFVNYRTCATAL